MNDPDGGPGMGPGVHPGMRPAGTAGAVALAATLVAAPAAAANFGYTQFSIGASAVELDEPVTLTAPGVGSVEFERLYGLGLSGSFEVTEGLYLGAGSSHVARSERDIEITDATVDLNAGFAAPIGSRADLIVELGYVARETDFCQDFGGGVAECVRISDDGIAIGAGARVWLRDDLELFGSFVRISWDEAVEETDGYSAGLAAWFGKPHSLRLAWTSTDETRSLDLAWRYTFRR